MHSAGTSVAAPYRLIMNQAVAGNIVSLCERLATNLREPAISDADREALFCTKLAALDNPALQWIALRIEREQDNRGDA